MPSTHMQLVKWTFPTLAILFGLFWYRRRRADRVDPGGKSITDSDSNSNTIKSSSSSSSLKRSSSLCDSGINTDDSFSINTSCSSPIIDISTPRKVSSSLDIPGRKQPASLPISMKSMKSIEERIPWYDEDDEDEDIPEARKIKLGSNPRSSCFEMMSNNRPFFDKTQIESEIKLPKICDNVIEEDKVLENHSTEQVSDKQEVENISAPDNCEKSVNTVVSSEEKCQTICERDSANHSPVSAVLDGSLTDEARSEGSTDSGKGGSIKGPTVNNIRSTYDFSVPLHLVGKLIGQKGNFLQSIRAKADVKISVKRFPNMKNHKLCAIEGSPEGINLALSLIRQKFPEKKYPQFTLEQITMPKTPDELPWIAEMMHLSLVEGVNNDVLVCYIVKPNRLFIQIPTHPTYPMLRTVDETINHLYETNESPPVPEELCRGMIFVAKIYNRWVRVYVENPDPKGEEHLVRLVDHGGYWRLSSADMRKIRSDCLSLPFQAIEVFLANVQPVNGVWAQEAYDLVAQICCGIVGQAQIEGYVDSQTYVSLYLNIQKHGVISLADELIARGYAKPALLEEVIEETELPCLYGKEEFA